MSQETSYTRQRSYSSSNNTSKPLRSSDTTNSYGTSTSPKTGHRYSSSANGNLTRHYATPEESEAVIPIFSTPTHMYLRQELNAQSRGSPQYTATPQYTSPKQTPAQPPYSPTQPYSSTQQKNGHYEPAKPPGSPLSYGRTRAESAATSRPTMENSDSQPTSQTSTTTLSKKDMLLAQLVDMGFSLEASKVAMTASGGLNLQEILDILVQNATMETQIPSTDHHHHQSAPPAPSSNPRPTRNSQPPPPSQQQPRPPSRTSQQGKPSSEDDEDEDPELEKENEEKFKREQEERRREYLDQLKREKPIPPTPSPRPTTMDTAYADRERKQGNFYFNKGQFVEAEAFYSAAIASLPIGHSELVLLCNNRAAARLKLGKYHECLSDCAVAIDIARKQMTYSAILGDPTWRSQMIKALHRKASALEGLGMFEAAIQSYEEYIRLEGSRSAQVAQGIQRCQQALLEKRHPPPPPPPHPSQQQQQQQPPPQPPRPSTHGPNWKPSNTTSAFPDIDFNMFIPKHTPEQLASQEEINKSKAVKEMREREKQKEAEDLERLQNEDKVNAKIVSWKMGKDRNLRALLGSLHVILWPGVQWKSVQMSELLEPRKCKITYMKAIAKVHPDKLPANATVEQRMLASSIFTTLNQAWDLFKIENKL